MTLLLSDILIEEHELDSFRALTECVRRRAQRALFFRMDVRPPFPDTPENWEDLLESAFSTRPDPR